MSGFFLLLPTTCLAAGGDSLIYSCEFSEDLSGRYKLRMKEYVDPATNTLLGKVDLMQSSSVIESIPTKVLQIPIFDSDIFMQIWLEKDLRVDAQMLLNSRQSFKATYVRGRERKALSCELLY